jgi:hypothetical protein
MMSVSSSPVRDAAPLQRAAIDELAKAAYKLSASDARLRGRATREPGALSLTHARALKSLAECGPMTIGALAERVETTIERQTQLERSLDEALADLDATQVQSVATVLLRLADLYDTL